MKGKYMRVFISFNFNDKPIVDILRERLSNDGHKVMGYDTEIRPGDNIMNIMNEAYETADAYLLILSRNYFGSRNTKKEYNLIELLEISESNKKIIPILIDDTGVPSNISRYKIYKLANNKKISINRMISFIVQQLAEEEKHEVDNEEEYIHEKEIAELRKALRDGKLTLVCGAGASKKAGVPNWDELLRMLLENMMNKLSTKKGIRITENSALEFNERYQYSTLVIGKYLKYNIGDEFESVVRETLYSKAEEGSGLVNSIVNLIRPTRDRKSLDSVITFNFDTILEENLNKYNVEFKSIYDEGMKQNSCEIPIYHVHGYLPRFGDIPPNANLVFSEDTYHNQFIEPFSWSNLIQLNKFSQNKCLFLGLSLSDPNLRRLLDVSSRKNKGDTVEHYIIKRKPYKVDDIDKIAYMLEEQDANELGLNIIWVNSFEDIPNVLDEISK